MAARVVSTDLTPPAGYKVLDRGSWSALGRELAPVGVCPPAGSPVGEEEWRDSFVPLAHVVGLHLDARSGLRHQWDAAGLPAGGPFVTGIAGSVSVGKSTFASALATLLAGRPEHPHVEVVSTDGFLLPNSVLGPRGLLGRKGFPESYDYELIADVMGRMVTGAPDVCVPLYSHDTYDLTGAQLSLGCPDVVIVEGVNALSPGPAPSGVGLADFCSLGVYLDASEADLRAWYVERFLGLIEGSRTDPSSFFAQWGALGHDDAAQLAASVWEGVNLVNLTDHILPTRWRADLVVRTDASHALSAVAVRLR